MTGPPIRPDHRLTGHAAAPSSASAVVFFVGTLAAVGAAIAALPWTPDDVSGMVLLVALLLVLALGATPGDASSGWWTGRRVLMLALVWRGVAAVVQRLYPLPSLYTLDAQMYDHEAWAIAQAWLSDARVMLPGPSLNVAAFEALVAGVYVVVGRSALTLQVLGAFMGALAVYYAWRSACLLIGESRAGMLALVLALWPSHVVWSSQSIRDPWVFFLLSRTVWSAVLWLKYARPSEWVKATGFAALAGVLRLSTAILLWGALLSMTAYVGWRSFRWPGRLSLMLFALGGVALVGMDLATGEFAMSAPARLSDIRQRLATGGAAFFADTRYASWQDVLEFVPLAAVYVLLAPFPWAADTPAQLASAVENSLLYLLVVLALPRIRGVWSVLRQPTGAFVGLLVLLFIGFLAIIEGNLGTAYRHKVQFLPCLLLLVAAGWPVCGAGWRFTSPSLRPAVPVAR